MLEIALESGFGSASRFSDTFKKHLGCAPREYRAALAGRAAD
jgi:AraC-like DNA-binding protein